jgi:hypothetical protein
MAAGRVSRDGVAALEGLAIGELYEALGSATTPDDIEAQVLQLSENRSDPSALRQHFDSAEVVSNGSVTPPASTRRSAIAPLLAAVRLCGARPTPTYEAKAPRNRQVIMATREAISGDAVNHERDENVGPPRKIACLALSGVAP